MSRAPLIIQVAGQYQFPAMALKNRLNYKLAQLSPYRRLYYRANKKNYFLRVTSTDQALNMQEQGPYYYKYFIALADHINLWTLPERDMNPKVVVENGQVTLQEPLPPELRFDVVTHVIIDAATAMRKKEQVNRHLAGLCRQGLPEAEALILQHKLLHGDTVPPVTAAVTAAPEDEMMIKHTIRTEQGGMVELTTADLIRIANAHGLDAQKGNVVHSAKLFEAKMEADIQRSLAEEAADPAPMWTVPDETEPGR